MKKENTNYYIWEKGSINYFALRKRNIYFDCSQIKDNIGCHVQDGMNSYVFLHENEH